MPLSQNTTSAVLDMPEVQIDNVQDREIYSYISMSMI